MDEFFNKVIELRQQAELEHRMTHEVFSEDRKKHIEDIQHKFVSSLIPIGIDPRGKDLLEVIAELADKLNTTMTALYHLKTEFYTSSLYNK